MTSETVFSITITLLYATFIEVRYSEILKFDNLSWNEGFLKCRNGSRLPSISTTEGGLSYHLSDTSSQGYSGCFWLGATYDAVDSASDVKYPSQCCEIIWKTSNKINIKCEKCDLYYKYVCSTDGNMVTRVQTSQENVPWTYASSSCTSYNLSLPLRNNSGLIDSFYDSSPPLWTRSVRRLNINPNLGPDQIPICFCNGVIKFFDCPQKLTTLCISVHTTGMTYPAVYAITSMNKEAMLSNNLSVTSYVNMSDFPRNSTEETSIKDNNRIEREPTTWLILGGGIGAVVVFVVVVVIIIILLRRRRMKNAHDAVLNSTNNNTPSGKVLTQTSLSYETIIGESFALEAPIATLPQASTVRDKESVIYAQPHKVNQKCRNLMNNQYIITQSTDDKEEHGLYSKVLKEQKTCGISTNPMESGGQGKECYNISSVESENDEYLGNVQVEQTSNVYDKANFHLEVLEIDTRNNYDKATFHRPQNSNYDTTYIPNATFDSTYDHLN